MQAKRKYKTLRSYLEEIVIQLIHRNSVKDDETIQYYIHTYSLAYHLTIFNVILQYMCYLLCAINQSVMKGWFHSQAIREE